MNLKLLYFLIAAFLIFGSFLLVFAAVCSVLCAANKCKCPKFPAVRLRHFSLRRNVLQGQQTTSTLAILENSVRRQRSITNDRSVNLLG
jgi:hypothetical protein